MPLITPKRIIKAIFVVSAIGFIVVDVSILLRDDDASSNTSADSSVARNHLTSPSLPDGAGDNLLKREHNRLLNQIANITRRSDANISQSSAPLPRFSHFGGNLSEVRAAVLQANRLQRIANLDVFDLVTNDAAVVVVVQVHNRTEYLRHLISSLRKAVDVEQTLLVFSHDVYSDELNDIISSIDFCPVCDVVIVVEFFFFFSFLALLFAVSETKIQLCAFVCKKP